VEIVVEEEGAKLSQEQALTRLLFTLWELIENGIAENQRKKEKKKKPVVGMETDDLSDSAMVNVGGEADEVDEEEEEEDGMRRILGRRNDNNADIEGGEDEEAGDDLEDLDKYLEYYDEARVLLEGASERGGVGGQLYANGIGEDYGGGEEDLSVEDEEGFADDREPERPGGRHIVGRGGYHHGGMENEDDNDDDEFLRGTIEKAREGKRTTGKGKGKVN